jgi:hypothetical protein
MLCRCWRRSRAASRVARGAAPEARGATLEARGCGQVTLGGVLGVVLGKGSVAQGGGHGRHLTGAQASCRRRSG